MSNVAWITGGSGAIGSAICLALAKTGMDIAVCYHRHEGQAQKVVQDCLTLGVKAEPIQLNLQEATSVQEAYQNICISLGTPSILIHAAGILQTGLIQDFTEDEYQQVMDIHVGGAFRLVQTSVPSMIRKKWGRIIFITSVWGEIGGAGEVLYSAAKGALNSMAKALAKELAPSGITVNAVAPGVIQSPMMDRQLDQEEQLQLKIEIPKGRFGSPTEVASLVLYLTTLDAAYLTGQVLNVDGGWS